MRETLALSAWRTVRCSQLCAAPRSVRIASSASHHACQPRRKQLPRHSFTAWCSRRTSVRCAATPSCHVEKARRRENGPVFRLATNAGAAARDASRSGCRRVRGRALALALAIVATLRARSLSTPRGSWPANGRATCLRDHAQLRNTAAQHALADEQRFSAAQRSDSSSSSSSSIRQERHSATDDQVGRGVSWQTCCLRLRRVTCPKRAREEQNWQQRARARLAAKADANNTKRHAQHSKWVGGRGSGRS